MDKQKKTRVALTQARHISTGKKGIAAWMVWASQGVKMIEIEYNASVFTPAGWRGVTITASAEKISAGMAMVTSITAIDGEEPVGYTSRTGAKRQQYHAAGVAQREVGKKKRLSACSVRELAA